MDPLPLLFQVQDPAKLRREMVNAGLRDVRVEETSAEMKYQSGKHLWDWVTNSNPIVGMILGQLVLSREQVAMIQQAMDDLIRERAAGSGTAVLISPINVGIGMKCPPAQARPIRVRRVSDSPSRGAWPARGRCTGLADRGTPLGDAGPRVRAALAAAPSGGTRLRLARAPWRPSA